MPKTKHRKPSNQRQPHQRATPKAVSRQNSTPHAPATEQDNSSDLAFGNSIPSPAVEAPVAATVIEPESLEVHTNAQKCTHLVGGGLTPRQLAALPLIVAASSNAQGARSAGIARRTLYKWLDDPDFRAELTRLREEAVARARADHQGAMSLALSTLVQCTQHENALLSYYAARHIYNTGLQVSDLQKLNERIQHLEQARNS